MRFKSFFYNFILVFIIIIIMEAVGFFGLRSTLESTVENLLQNRAKKLASELNDERNLGKEKETLDKANLPEGFYAWIINNQGTYVIEPTLAHYIKPNLRESDEKIVNPKAVNSSVPSFAAGSGEDRRLVYSEKLQSGNHLIVAAPMAFQNEVMGTYLKISGGVAVTILILALIALIYISGEIVKPVLALQEYATNIAVGDVIAEAESLKEPDIVSVAKILERFYGQTKRQHDLDHNPLSGLPGNKSLYDALFKRIEAGLDLAIGYLDANNFAAFNSKYGFEKGDSVIRFIGTTILNSVNEAGNKDDQIFHLGKDRFIFISTPDKIQSICERIITDYDTHVVYYYDEESREKGYIRSKDKTGKEGDFPFMPICIGIATNARRPLIHPLQIGHIVGEIRNYLRQRQQSAYLIDRRAVDRGDEQNGKMAPFPKSEIDKAKFEVEQMERKEKLLKPDGQPVREITVGGDSMPIPYDDQITGANEQNARVPSPAVIANAQAEIRDISQADKKQTAE